jgi:hypothetical protein
LLTPCNLTIIEAADGATVNLILDARPTRACDSAAEYLFTG